MTRGPTGQRPWRREAEWALLGQKWSWVAEVEGGSQRPGGKDKGALADFRRWAWPKRIDRFYYYYFLNLIFNAKTFLGNPRKCYKARKILRNCKNSRKIPRARLEHEQSK
jgi:hypothetical protein